MSDFSKYDQKYAVHASGLTNTGVICYWNSLLQGLLSCTSLNKLITEDEKVRNKNSLTKKYADMVEAMRKGGDQSTWSPLVWNEFISVLNSKERKDKVKFGSGQEDSSEGLQLLLDMFESPLVDRLFEHRFRSTISCGHCGKKCSVKEDESIAVEMYNSEVKEYTPQNYIVQHSPPIDDNFTCPLCKKKGLKTQRRILTMSSEVIILLFKKYDAKWTASFPQELRFPGSNGKKFVYKQVAQVEHSGGTGGGHYWARALRADGKIYTLNDTSKAESQWACTDEAYLVFYHIL